MLCLDKIHAKRSIFMDIDSKNSKVFTDRKDFTIFQLFNMYVEGNIKLQPDY